MTLKHQALTLTVSLLLALPAGAAAQNTAPYRPVAAGGGGGEGGTYLKAGLAHWQGNIFSSNSLTHWNGDPFGADYKLTSVGVGFETWFDHRRLLLSGWSIGYRKDDIDQKVSGHMIHGGVFGSLNAKVFQVRMGGGVEWGSPSLNFDTSTFDYRADGAVRYNHTYPAKNADVPGLGTRKNGALYPYLEGSIVERVGPFLFEGGMRVNFVRFQFDSYQVDAKDRITYAFNSKRVLMPMIFLDVGFRMF
jgi:hypothetical protein